jgi:hypothetical protein
MRRAMTPLAASIGLPLIIVIILIVILVLLVLRR